MSILLKLLHGLEGDMSKSMCSFNSNQMVVNARKFQVTLFGLSSNEKIILEVGGCSNYVATSVTVLRVTIDSELRFNLHVLQTFQKAKSSFSAFSRTSKYLAYPLQHIYNVSV